MHWLLPSPSILSRERADRRYGLAYATMPERCTAGSAVWGCDRSTPDKLGAGVLRPCCFQRGRVGFAGATAPSLPSLCRVLHAVKGLREHLGDL